MRLSFQQIEAFVTVAEMGNFSAAAKQLKKDRSTLSQIVKNLEIDLGYELFSREGRYPSLTEQGLSLYDYAKRLSTEALCFEGIAQRIFDGIEEELNIAVSSVLPATWLSTTLATVRKQYPHIKVNWLHDSTEVVKQRLLDGKVDLAIVLVTNGKGHSSIEPTFVHNLPLVAVKSPVSNIPTSTTVAALSKYRQLIAQDLSIDSLKNLYGLSRDTQVVHCTHLLLSLLQSGEGWAYLPHALVQPHINKGELELINIKEVKTETTVAVSIWTLPSVSKTPVKDAITSILTKLVSNDKQGPV